jgi:hypothetical protein
MNSEFENKRAELDVSSSLSRLQQTVYRGEQSGPKAFLGCRLGLSFMGTRNVVLVARFSVVIFDTFVKKKDRLGGSSNDLP